MLDKISQFARTLSQRGDLVIVIIIMTAVIMMIVPLPTGIVDVIITLNIAVGVIILLVAFYITTPIQFSALPSVILIATLFRLAITITTTRLILLQADAGEVVQTFGDFVIGGNVAVGLVIFAIITIAQFVVITKGGERVAEVAARFCLDALPGKQMSIDNELRSGDITQAEARGLRRSLERESHLYGAMDGAMKFVKGDAIAGLVIIFVNLIGGLTVGMAQQGLTFGQAIQTFSLLTVGDGLVAQIPALLISIGAGTVVTRVATEEKRDLGSEITGQLVQDERVHFVAGGILIGLSFVPGFPTYIFIGLAIALFAGGIFIRRRNQMVAQMQAPSEPAKAIRVDQPEEQAAAAAIPQTDEQKPITDSRIVMHVGEQLAAAIDREEFAQASRTARRALNNDLGVDFPSIALATDSEAAPNGFHIDLEDVPVFTGEISTDCVLVESDKTLLDISNIPYEPSIGLFENGDAVWVNETHTAQLNEAGVKFLHPVDVLVKSHEQTLRRYATHFMGIQETRALLTSVEPEFGELIQDVLKVLSIQKVSDVLRRLVEENIPIRNLRIILESLIDWGSREKDVLLLTEHVRTALARQICFRVADRNRVIAAYIVDRATEEALRAGLRTNSAGTFLNMADDTARSLLEQFRTLMGKAKPETKAVVLTAIDVRRHLRNFLARNGIDLPVLSYQELAVEFSVQPLATVSVAAYRQGRRTQSRLKPQEGAAPAG